MTEKRFVRMARDGGEIDGASHEELVAMVQHTDPVAVMQVGQRLLLAAQKMDEVSNELHAHMSGLDWEGSAADSFKSWGSQVSRSTMDLASYSRNAGTYMASAGETLSAVKSGMPDVPHADMKIVSRYNDQPNTAVTVGGAVLGSVVPGVGTVIGGWAAGKVADMVDSDWVTPEEAQAAQRRVEQAHNEAVQQMTRLSQAYEQSTTRLNSVQPPEFPPLPGDNRHEQGLENVPVGGGDGGGSGRGPGGGGMPTPPRVQPAPAPNPTPQPTPTPVPRPAPWQPPVHGGPVQQPPWNPPVHNPLPPVTDPVIKDPGTRIDHTPPPGTTLPDPRIPVHGGGAAASAGAASVTSAAAPAAAVAACTAAATRAAASVAAAWAAAASVAAERPVAAGPAAACRAPAEPARARGPAAPPRAPRARARPARRGARAPRAWAACRTAVAARAPAAPRAAAAVRAAAAWSAGRAAPSADSAGRDRAAGSRRAAPGCAVGPSGAPTAGPARVRSAAATAVRTARASRRAGVPTTSTRTRTPGRRAWARSTRM
ncbi:WXG100 family type VII secretion target [Kitasatospora cheerisanensis]|uniref:Uncharacterized protein n=1 Tax=Kitasatospora cheerisanensis KCTC 2395 TaxID=1348663 RepID=A0A066Z5A6_9ACTN|nr:hypothetical protein [Kitasatospora cheerisanensis]KDN85345.1 hypothetical protein KCH_29260 [Kitasatospora cheerisanensis KCTC 2395]